MIYRRANRCPTGFSWAWVAAIPFLLGFSSGRAVDFSEHIRPILEKKCLGCHTANIAKGGVALDTRSSVFDEGEDLVVPGNALHSELYLVATPEEPGEKPYMPEEGDPLTAAEADLLKEWIDSGAEWPDGLVLREASKTDKSWWAYRELEESPRVLVEAGRSDRNPVDLFIEQKLDEENLVMNGPADRRSLIRRATYDLTGLPPTPEEVEAFVADPDPDAYEKVIERLLASPRYGERWGRHWLDVVRFGESRGFERN